MCHKRAHLCEDAKRKGDAFIAGWDLPTTLARVKEPRERFHRRKSASELYRLRWNVTGRLCGPQGARGPGGSPSGPLFEGGEGGRYWDRGHGVGTPEGARRPGGDWVRLLVRPAPVGAGSRGQGRAPWVEAETSGKGGVGRTPRKRFLRETSAVGVFGLRS